MKLNFRVNDTMHEISVDPRLTLLERDCSEWYWIAGWSTAGWGLSEGTQSRSPKLGCWCGLPVLNNNLDVARIPG